MSSPEPPAKTRLIQPYESVMFANGVQVTLEDDGRLRVIACGRGLRGITIHPGSDNSCRISTVGQLVAEPEA